MYIDSDVTTDFAFTVFPTSVLSVELGGSTCTYSDPAESLSVYYPVHGHLSFVSNGAVEHRLCSSSAAIVIAPTQRKYKICPVQKKARFYAVDLSLSGSRHPELDVLQEQSEAKLKCIDGLPHIAMLDFLYRLLWEFHSPDSHPEMLSLLAESILLMLTDRNHETDPFVRDGGSHEALASSADALIDSEYAYVHSIADIASTLRCNSAYLERSYLAARGMTVTKALHSRRVREACSVIRADENLTIKQVALWCGYGNYEYFLRVFKKVVGMTPSAFRREVFCSSTK